MLTATDFANLDELARKEVIKRMNNESPREIISTVNHVAFENDLELEERNELLSAIMTALL